MNSIYTLMRDDPMIVMFYIATFISLRRCVKTDVTLVVFTYKKNTKLAETVK